MFNYVMTRVAGWTLMASRGMMNVTCIEACDEFCGDQCKEARVAAVIRGWATASRKLGTCRE
jgi:hypothetical protein